MSQNSAGPARRPQNVFINYRREDTAGHAGRLFDRLSSRLPGRVFMDVDTIEPGVDFAEVIGQAVGKCEVLIVMIGREWLRVKDAAGSRRLTNPEDFVRLEVAAALQRNIRVIPVLVEGATMPRPDDLPPDLARLARRNAIELSDARWAFDVDRLIRTIEGVLQETAPAPPVPHPPEPVQPPQTRGRKIAWLAVPALVLLILAGWTAGRLLKPGTPEQPAETASSQIPAAPEKAPEEKPAETSPAVKPAAQEEEVSAPLPEPEQASYGPDACRDGLVWREAGPADHVCVTPATRDLAAEDNRQAAARRNPAGGAYGPDTCLSGYVWREAFDGDRVCVTPETRDQVRRDNKRAKRQKLGSSFKELALDQFKD